MARPRRELMVALVTLMLSSFFVVYLWIGADGNPWSGVSQITVPLAVISFVAVLAGIHLVQAMAGLRHATRSASPGNDTPAPAADDTANSAEYKPNSWRAIVLVAWTLLYIVALPLVGYLVGTIAYVGGLAGLFGNRRPLPIVLLMAILPLAILFFFERYMTVLLPAGRLFQ